MIHEPLKFTKDQVTFGRKFITNDKNHLIDKNDQKVISVIEYEGVIHQGRKVVTSCVVNTVNERYDYTDQVAVIMENELGKYSFTWECKITLKPM